MDRWFLKYLVKRGLGSLPLGVSVYDLLTAGVLGTQRAVPGKWCRWFREHLLLVRRHTELELAHPGIWCLDVGATLTPGMLARLVSDGDVLMTDQRRRLRERYTGTAIEAVANNLAQLRRAGAARGKEVLYSLPGARGARDVMERLALRYLAPVEAGGLEGAEGSFGLCMSMGALEHYPADALEGLIGNMGRFLHAGGVASHIVDHRDHLWHFDQTKDCFYHLRFSDEQWQRMAESPLLYLNRLLRSDYLRLFEEAGFEVRYAGHGLHERDTVGVARERLWGRYASASDEDLRAAVTHFVAVRR